MRYPETFPKNVQVSITSYYPKRREAAAPVIIPMPQPIITFCGRICSRCTDPLWDFAHGYLQESDPRNSSLPHHNDMRTETRCIRCICLLCSSFCYPPFFVMALVCANAQNPYVFPTPIIDNHTVCEYNSMRKNDEFPKHHIIKRKFRF